LADAPISPTHGREDEKRGEVICRGPAACRLMRAFDPVEGAGYETAEASA